MFVMIILFDYCFQKRNGLIIEKKKNLRQEKKNQSGIDYFLFIAPPQHAHTNMPQILNLLVFNLGFLFY
jgi:hypothetical protein